MSCEWMGGTYKLSCGPKTFVGIALVKLSPNWSLYALPRISPVIAADRTRKCALVLHVN